MLFCQLHLVYFLHPAMLRFVNFKFHVHTIGAAGAATAVVALLLYVALLRLC